MTSSQSRKAVVFGSIDAGHVSCVERFCLPSETTFANDYSVSSGGKGAKQAIAIARAGAAGAMAGRINEDLNACFGLETLRANGMDSPVVRAVPSAPTGREFSQVTASGKNTICVVPGINPTLLTDALPANAVEAGDVVVLQGETPSDTIQAVIVVTMRAGARVTLNLTPWVRLPKDARALLAGHPLEWVVQITKAALVSTATFRGATSSLLSATLTKRLLANHEVFGPMRSVIRTATAGPHIRRGAIEA